MDDPVLLAVEEMAAADAAAIAAGISGERLMEAAGRAVAREIGRRWSAGPVAVLCGPGNNGGDGFVVARILAGDGVRVRLALAGDAGRLRGDAARNAKRWTGDVGGEILALSPAAVDGAEVVVDALFGAGLTRPLEGAARETVLAIGDRPVVAVDMPSGVHGDTGQVLGGADGVAARAALTVTFFRRKPGHLLLPGRLRCGELVVADIGIPDSVLAEIRPRTRENGPALWLDRWPWPRLTGHKYDRGHAVIAGGAEMTGAARLAARAALRAGAGLVTVAAPASALPVYRTEIAGILSTASDGPGDFAGLLADRRRNAVLVGPGNGVGPETRNNALAALAAGKAVVLDADAITVFGDDPETLFAAIREAAGECVLTPHDGEYAQLFPADGNDDRLSRARTGAAASGATIILKGGDTTIAAPDGRAAINSNAPADLATAGSGDVLSGFVLALLAQGMNAFDAARAAVWLHGAAGAACGPGLIADDLPESLRSVLPGLRRMAAADGPRTP